MSMLKYYIVLAVVFFCITIPLVFKENINTFDAQDERNHHYPAIINFAETFPNLDLVNYKSATTPFYHLVMMTVLKLTNLSLNGLRLVSSLFSLACVLVVFRYLLTKTANANKSLLLTLIFMFSTYFVGAAIRLETDNAALLFVILTIIVLDTMPLTVGRFVVAGIMATLAVLTRQIHLWLVGVGGFIALFQWNVPINKRIVGAAAMLLPALALLPFLLLWRGLSPAGYNDAYQASFINIDNFSYGISVFGTLALAFWPWYWRMYKENRPNPLILIGVAVVAVIFLFIFPVGAEGRLDGSVWKFASLLPSILRVSIFFWIIFPLGAVLYALTVIDGIRNKDLLMPVAAALWLVANLASAIGFQKYFEPFWLFYIAVSIKRITNEGRYYWILPVLLILAFIAFDVGRFFL
jgi:hypothetical protein